jgi:hypothetical protein
MADDGSGDIFLADSGNAAVRRISIDGKMSTLLIGDTKSITLPKGPWDSLLTMTVAGEEKTPVVAPLLWIIDSKRQLLWLYRSSKPTQIWDIASAQEVTPQQWKKLTRPGAITNDDKAVNGLANNITCMVYCATFDVMITIRNGWVHVWDFMYIFNMDDLWKIRPLILARLKMEPTRAHVCSSPLSLPLRLMVHISYTHLCNDIVGMLNEC